MKTTLSSRRNHYLVRVGIFLITAALIAGMADCGSEGGGNLCYLTITSTYGGSVITPGEGYFYYAANTTVELVAVPNEHYHFVNWTGNVSDIADVNAAATNITMNHSSYFITANFELDPGWYSLTISSTEGGSVTTPGEGTFVYAANTTVDLAAQPNGYPFVKWTGDVGTIANVEATATNITMYSSYSITAHFGIKIWDWPDLDAIRDNLGGRYCLVNDLNSTTAGYEELASPTANGGKGWHPIGTISDESSFTGTFDGLGHEICDLFINRPDEYTVGLFGQVISGVIKDVGVMNATVTGNEGVGSLVGRGQSTVSNSYSTGIVTGYSSVGGLMGVGSGWINNCYSTGSVTGNECVGGLVGESYALLSNSYSSGTVTGGLHVGGLVGVNGDPGVVSNSYSTGNVSGDTSVGGLVGYNYQILSGSYSTGSVTGNESVGGLVGLNGFAGTVSNSYSTSSVTGNSSVGGLVGLNNIGSSVSDSYSTGSVTGNDYVGGLVGWNYDTVSNSFWDTQTSGQLTSAGGTGKTTAQMKSIFAFSGVGWNIIAVALNETNLAYIWNIVDNVTYPFLSWQAI
jgi:hypothetical protein